jgi:hypothetical protein
MLAISNAPAYWTSFSDEEKMFVNISLNDNFILLSFTTSNH